MRIIAGSVKGRTLRAPAGGHTRPTSDRVRGALFSMLQARLPPDGFAELRVLDLYAGSGALALEALSRGAAQAIAVDSSAAAARAIQENAATLGFGTACVTMRLSVEAAIAQLATEGRQFDVILADPPYAQPPDQLIQIIVDGGLLAAGGFLMVEHSRKRVPGATAGGLELEARRRHGDTELSLYRWEGAADK